MTVESCRSRLCFLNTSCAVLLAFMKPCLRLLLQVTASINVSLHSSAVIEDDYFMTCPLYWKDGTRVTLTCAVKRPVVDNGFCCTTGLYHMSRSNPFCAVSVNDPTGAPHCQKKGCFKGLRENCQQCNGWLRVEANDSNSRYIFSFSFRVKAGLHDGNWSCASATTFTGTSYNGKTHTTTCGSNLHTRSMATCTGVTITPRIFGMEKTYFFLLVIGFFLVVLTAVTCGVRHFFRDQEEQSVIPYPAHEMEQEFPVSDARSLDVEVIPMQTRPSSGPYSGRVSFQGRPSLSSPTDPKICR